MVWCSWISACTWLLDSHTQNTQMGMIRTWINREWSSSTSLGLLQGRRREAESPRVRAYQWKLVSRSEISIRAKIVHSTKILPKANQSPLLKDFQWRENPEDRPDMSLLLSQMQSAIRDREFNSKKASQCRPSSIVEQLPGNQSWILLSWCARQPALRMW